MLDTIQYNLQDTEGIYDATIHYHTSAMVWEDSILLKLLFTFDC